MNPDPFAGHPGSSLEEELFEVRAGHRAVPPRAERNGGRGKGDLVAIDEQTVSTGLSQPFGKPLARRITRIGVVVARNDEQARLIAESSKISLDDNNLNIRVQGAGDVQEISADRHDVVGTGVCQQPIKLLQTVMEISNVKDSHAYDRMHCARRGSPAGSRR
jgi:hypothetical protein